MAEAKKPRLELSNDPKKWLEWFEELSDEEAPNGETDSGEEDHVSESDHYTNSEQEAENTDNDISDDEETGNNISGEISPEHFYIGKDGVTKWKKIKQPTNVRTRSCNIIIHLPGPKGKAREEKSEIGIFNLFLDEHIVQSIVTCTNVYIDKIRSNFARKRDARHTNVVEIRAFIGLLYLIGTLRSSRKNLTKIWDNSKGNGIESCYLSISERRFRFLLRSLRFYNIHDRDARKEIDKLAPIREILELFTNNFQKYYSASEYLTVDEQLLAFRGNCRFRQYIPSEPAKYGLKVFALSDAKSAYTFSLEPYVASVSNLMGHIASVTLEKILFCV